MIAIEARTARRSIAAELTLAGLVFASGLLTGMWHIRLLRAGGEVFTPYDHNLQTPAPLYGLALGALTALAYALCRRASNRTIAVAAAFAFMTSPLQLYVLPSLEHDYLKAVFIVAAALILSFVIRGVSGPRTLVRLCALGGVVLGIGFHFRQDVVLHAAMFAAAVMLLPASPARLGVNARVAGVASFAIIFVTTRYIVKEGPNALGFGPVAAYGGLMTPYDAALGLTRPPYDAGYKWIDEYVFAMAPAQAQLIQGTARSPDSLQDISRDAAGDFVRVALNTPADAVVRAYASLVQVLDIPFRYVLAPPGVPAAAGRIYAWRALVAGAPIGTGLLICGAALAATAASDAWLAAVLAALLLYLGAYPSLSFQARHYFHLEIATWVALAFLIHRALTRRRWNRRAAGRAAAFLAVSIAVLLIPLAVLRMYQSAHVRALFMRYSEMGGEAVAVTKTEMPDGRARFSNAALLPLPARGGLAAGFLIADFDARACNGREIAAVFRYDYAPRDAAPGRRQDFSWTVHLRLDAENGPRESIALVAVSVRDGYGWFGQEGYSRFEGVEMAAADAPCFSGMRNVKDTAGAPVLFNVQSLHTSRTLYQQFVPWEIGRAPTARPGSPGYDDPSSGDIAIGDPAFRHPSLNMTPGHVSFAGHITRMTPSMYTANERYYHYGDPPDLLATQPQLHARGDRLVVEGRLGAGGLTVHLRRDGRSERDAAITTPGRFSVTLETPEDGAYSVGVSSNVDGFSSLEERFTIDRAQWIPPRPRTPAS
jgi:hypothetical protein